ncbi:MAG: nuclear transport factor 2 family protein [Pseudomonadota bacterium]
MREPDAADLIAMTDALDRAVDAKDFAAARAMFADTIWFSAEALGAAGGDMPADALIAAWARNLNRHKHSFHMRTNHQVAFDGDGRATVRSAGYAWNRLDSLGDALWEVWGDYVHRFARIDGRWRIVGFDLVVRHQRGDFAVRDTLPPED